MFGVLLGVKVTGLVLLFNGVCAADIGVLKDATSGVRSRSFLSSPGDSWSFCCCLAFCKILLAFVFASVALFTC
jgi:hypothetical protein